MKRILYFVILFGLATACEAQVVGGLAEVAIIDRDSGATLNPYFYRGEYWIAGRPGARYAIEIRNRLDERLLAVTSVDGVNVVSGATAAWDQAGYVFNGGERYQITGWRKSDVQVAAFTFTDSPNSYAERTGRPPGEDQGAQRGRSAGWSRVDSAPLLTARRFGPRSSSAVWQRVWATSSR